MSLKPDKHFVSAAGIVLVAAVLIALTWVGTDRAIDAQRTENFARVAAGLSNQSLTFTEQIGRQILGLDQTLRILAAEWEENPQGFDLETERAHAAVLSGLSRDMVLADEKGIVRQSSVVEAVNQNISSLDYFRAISHLPAGQAGDAANPLYVGPATIDGIMRQWHMNVARRLHHPDGSFAGVIDTDFRIAAITDVFAQTDVGTGAFITLVGLRDAKLRGAVGPGATDPDISIADTPMYAAIKDASNGIWTGPSPNDAVRRIHAFRHIPDRDLVVVVAASEEEAMRPASVWRRQARFFASCITGLLAGVALLMVQSTRLARRREHAIAEDRATLAAANAQLEVARALATAKAEQLQATLAGMSDGVSMVDAHMCLVEWNAQFPEIAGVPAEILRVGLPMEEMLRAQAKGGQFGRIADIEAEVERRMARLRIAPFGVVQRPRPDGHTIELRRNRLPDGGFVTLYADVTEHKRAEEALRKAQEEAETANAAKSRFVAIVSHEIRTPLNTLLNTIRLLSDSDLSPAQQSLLTMARQSGDALFGLVNDILDLSQAEAGKLSIRPSLFELRPVLESCVEMFAGQAAARGIPIGLRIAEDTPLTLLTDPGRLRQVQLNLLSNAIKYAMPGPVLVTAEASDDPTVSVRITVRDSGPVISPQARARLFRPFSRLDRPGEIESVGTGLGLSICQQIMYLMGGQIGCDAWISETGQEGNVFWTTLPLAALPFRSSASVPEHVSLAPAGENELLALLRRPRNPRTRVLLTEDIPANQLITATLLRRQGHHVDIAESGQAAIRAIQAAPYDIVFMDIFMPGMGGIEATQIIRSLPPPAGNIPIVALTANVSAEDGRNFKAAGMNGLVSKPVSIADMLLALREYVWGSTPELPQPQTSAAERTEGDLEGILSIERIEELRAHLPPEQLTALMHECLLDLDHRMPALRRALSAKAPSSVNAHAHTMVGVAAAYGMVALEQKLRDVMRAAEELRLDSLADSTMQDIEAEFGRSAQLLREVVQTVAA